MAVCQLSPSSAVPPATASFNTWLDLACQRMARTLAWCSFLPFTVVRKENL